MGLVVGDVVAVKDFSMLLACSKSSFIFAGSSLTSSSFDVVEDVSSPSTFLALGDKSSPFSFGLGHDGDMCSGLPQFQHLLFSSFWSCDQLQLFPRLQPCSDRKNLHLPFSSLPSSFFVGDHPESSSNFFIFETFGFSTSAFFLELDVSWWTTCSNSATRCRSKEFTDADVGVEST